MAIRKYQISKNCSYVVTTSSSQKKKFDIQYASSTCKTVSIKIIIHTYKYQFEKQSNKSKLVNSMIANQFSFEHTINLLEKICVEIEQNKEVPIDQFCEMLDQFCIVFKEVNSFLGIAFSDVKEKTAIMKANREKLGVYPGLISFIKMEIQRNIHLYNSKNGKQNKGAPAQFKTYSSTARNLLRMMWLLTFLKVTFTRKRDFPNQDLSTTFGTAYDEAFGKNHPWMLQKSAKVAIYATSSRDKNRLYEIILKKKASQQEVTQYNERFLKVFLPVHEFLWQFYFDNKIDKLQ